MDFEASLKDSGRNAVFKVHGKTGSFWQCMRVLGDFSLTFTMLSPNCWALQSGSQDMLLGEVLTLVTARHSAISFRPFALLIGSFNACKKHACQLGSSSHS